MSAESWGNIAKPVSGWVARDNYERWRNIYPWKDNSWMVFWDEMNAVYGMVWSTTSPNGAPRKCRVVLSVDGIMQDLIEVPDIGTLSSKSVDLDGAFGEKITGNMTHYVVAKSERINIELTMMPRWLPIDYTAKHILPALPGAPELHHYQQGMTISGAVRLDGKHRKFDGHGFRDRTWGWRSEGTQFVEVCGGGICFHNTDVTLLKFLLGDGTTKVGGCMQNDGGQFDIHSASILYDERCLASKLVLDIEQLGEVELECEGQAAGWWMTFFERHTPPPVLCEYDMIGRWHSDQFGVGMGCIGHDVIRRLG